MTFMNIQKDSAEYWRGRYERQATELERATQRIDALERQLRTAWTAVVSQVQGEFTAAMDELRGELLTKARRIAELENEKAYAAAAEAKKNAGRCQYLRRFVQCLKDNGHTGDHEFPLRQCDAEWYGSWSGDAEAETYRCELTVAHEEDHRCGNVTWS